MKFFLAVVAFLFLSLLVRGENKLRPKTLDDNFLFERIKNIYKNLIDLKYVIDKVAEDSLRLLDITYFIFENDDTFLKAIIKIKDFKDFDEWFTRAVNYLLEYSKKWNNKTESSTSSTTTTSNLNSTSVIYETTTTRSTLISSNEFSHTTSITTTRTLPISNSSLISSTKPFFTPHTTETCVTYSTILNSSSSTNKLSTLETSTDRLVDVKFCNKYKSKDCTETAQDSGKPINIVPFVCKILCNRIY